MAKKESHNPKRQEDDESTEFPMPEGIDAPPEMIAFRIMNTPPKPEGEWDYEKEHRRRQRRNKSR